MTKDQDVSSSEITAMYRCKYPEISGDTLSQLLVSPAGKERAQAFIDKYNYPLVNQKISLRARAFLDEASRLIQSGHYDACISFASGFSLLNYLIAKNNNCAENVNYIDTDFAHMIEERNWRINKIELDPAILAKINSHAFDIEQAFKSGKSLKETFPQCHNPIFIIEGVSYFLSTACIDWLFEQIASYDRSAIIIDYWPDDMLETSQLFARVYDDLNQGMILEELKSFWGKSTLQKFKKHFPQNQDYSLIDLEEMYATDSKREMLDPNRYFPLRVISGKNT